MLSEVFIFNGDYKNKYKHVIPIECSIFLRKSLYLKWNSYFHYDFVYNQYAQFHLSFGGKWYQCINGLFTISLIVSIWNWKISLYFLKIKNGNSVCFHKFIPAFAKPYWIGPVYLTIRIIMNWWQIYSASYWWITYSETLFQIVS